MALGLLAGIGGGFTAIQRGIDDQRARDQAEEDRAYQREQRANAREDRAFGLGQRQRAVAEQQRQDAIRAGLSAVPQTREVDARPQAVREITVDDDGNPSATQLPATKTVAAPDWQKFKSTADVFRKNGEVEKADAYEQLASRAQFADSARRFQTVAAGAGTMSLEQLAQAAAEVYNSDPLPAQISGLKPVEGGLQFSFTNSDTGKSQTLVVKSKEELLQKLESYYSPDTYAAAMQARREAAEKAQAKLLEPRELSPGQIQVSGGKVIARNDNPTEAQIRAAGGEGGSGGSRGRASDGPFKSIDDVFKAIEGFSTIKTELNGQQAAEALRLARMFHQQQPRVDASAAASAAIRAAQDPAQIRPMFDERTGRIAAGMPFEGGNFIVREIGTVANPGPLKPEELRGIADAFVAKMPEDRKQLLLPAAFSPDGRARLSATVAADVRSPEGLAKLERAIGRKPTEADITSAVKAADGNIQQALQLIALHGDQSLRKQFGGKAAPGAPRGPGLGLTQPGSEVSRMDDITLERLSKIRGHANQKAAADELARRKAIRGASTELPTDTAGMLNLAP